MVVFGRPTLSRPVAGLLARRDVEKAIYVPRPVNWFTAGRRPETLITDLAGLFDFAGEGTPGWLERWQTASAAAESAPQDLQIKSSLKSARGRFFYTFF